MALSKLDGKLDTTTTNSNISPLRGGHGGSLSHNFNEIQEVSPNHFKDFNGIKCSAAIPYRTSMMFAKRNSSKDYNGNIESSRC
jgi:hypothetical protein